MDHVVVSRPAGSRVARRLYGQPVSQLCRVTCTDRVRQWVSDPSPCVCVCASDSAFGPENRCIRCADQSVCTQTVDERGRLLGVVAGA